MDSRNEMITNVEICSVQEDSHTWAKVWYLKTL